MIDEFEAIDRILTSTVRAGIDEVGVTDAAGRYLLEDIRSKVAVPGFDQSVMDGYALCSADLLRCGGKLRISGVNAAGAGNPGKLNGGEAMRIYTGAPLPVGADAVVMQEDVRVAGGELAIGEKVESGDYIRRRGEVLCRGQTIARAGEQLDPAKIGLLASQGFTKVEVASWPRVAVITTGDELVDPEVGELEFGQVFNSNAPMLETALRHLGIPVVDVYRVGDEEQPTFDVISSAVEGAEVVLIAGGLSVGDRDRVKPSLERCGVDIDFWRVKIKPGKPFLYASLSEGRQLFGLPGNPVSALVTFLIFVLPALQLRLGADRGKLGMRRVRSKALAPISNPGDRPHYVMGSFDPINGFLASSGQASQDILALAKSNALARISEGASIREGDILDLQVLWDY
jgi:molybdopterin molybdotransferase